MIQTPSALREAVEQMSRMYEALATLQQEIKPQNPELYAVMAEGPLEEIRRIQEEIDQYLAVEFPHPPSPKP